MTLPSGQTFVTWLSGNQNQPTAPNPGVIGFSTAALVEGTEEEWLRSYFEPRAAEERRAAGSVGATDAGDAARALVGTLPPLSINASGVTVSGIYSGHTVTDSNGQ